MNVSGIAAGVSSTLISENGSITRGAAHHASLVAKGVASRSVSAVVHTIAKEDQPKVRKSNPRWTTRWNTEEKTTLKPDIHPSTKIDDVTEHVKEKAL